jgi:hypothetical protein
MPLAALLLEAAPRVLGSAENISAREEWALERQSGLIAVVIFERITITVDQVSFLEVADQSLNQRSRTWFICC